MELVEELSGVKVENVVFKDMSAFDSFAEASGIAKPLAESIKAAPVTSWEGKSRAAGTSKEVREIYAPRITPRETLERMLKE